MPAIPDRPVCVTCKHLFPRKWLEIGQYGACLVSGEPVCCTRHKEEHEVKIRFASSQPPVQLDFRHFGAHRD